MEKDAIKAAGFQDVTIMDETPFSIEYALNDTTAKAVLGDLNLPQEKANEIENSVSSIKVYGTKPGSRQPPCRIG